jgi:hypothetical protein
MRVDIGRIARFRGCSIIYVIRHICGMGIRVTCRLNMIADPRVGSRLVIYWADYNRSIIPCVERYIRLLTIAAAPANLVQTRPASLVPRAAVAIHTSRCCYVPVAPVQLG